jgi:hypothetical protein
MCWVLSTDSRIFDRRTHNFQMEGYEMGHVARMGKMRNAYKILAENLNGRDHLEGPGEDNIKLDRNSGGMVWSGL